ncbi:MAG: pantetheine-phosphate adenylyltransferase [Rikenellaceae bacterium]
MKRIAIFPGSFDPFTRGHAAVVEQALLLFDVVIVAVGHNSEKRGFLTHKQRCALISDLYANEQRVEVESYQGLTIDFARSKGATAMIRGVRSVIDFEYERSLSSVNSRLCEDVVTLLLFAPAHLADISSNVVRELYSYNHPIDAFMPEGINIENYINRIIE